ncbi:MAG: pyridoxal-phosphate dependent enzyme, partial [Caulobacterales bacterium]
MKYDDILQTIGRTPIVRIHRLAPPGVNVFAKVESFNPMGSVKDRLALAVIEAAERSGELQPGQTVIEATSGNTGIGLAMVCARKGYPLVVTMAESFSVERRRLMRFLGAKVVLTPAALKGSGMLAKATELAKEHGWFLTRQFENEANAEIHARTTAREIISDFEGERLDYWVSTFGTGGTVNGVARVLKKELPHVRVVVAEPDNAQLLGSGISQTRDPDGAPRDSHPSFRPHVVQGASPDFISKLAEDAVRTGLIDDLAPIDGADALRVSQELACKEGIFVGISAGATMAAALEIARRAPQGSTILAMLPDTGERYLSTPLFEKISTEMTREELEISRSTPSCRFDAPSPSTPATAPVAQDAKADAFVNAVINDKDQPVVMFALKWCEFASAVRRMFETLAIPCRVIELDSVEFQKNDWGGRVRRALQARVNVPTIPQIFVMGGWIGGCTETF